MSMMEDMNGRLVAEGLFLTAWGCGLVYLTNRYRTSESWRLKVAQSRWGWDRRTSRKARELGEMAWVAHFSASQKIIVTWVALPFFALFTLIGCTILIRAFVG